VVEALSRNGLDASQADLVYDNQAEVDYKIYEIVIGEGIWSQYSYDEGVPNGLGWSGTFSMSDANTVVAKSEQSPCPSTYKLNRNGDDLTIDVVSASCSDPADLIVQTGMYESAPFHLVQTAGWAAPAPTPRPTPAGSSGTPAASSSTASQRQKIHPIGTVPAAPLGYWEYLPPDYGKQPSPLMVFLHGSGSSGAGDQGSLYNLVGTGPPNLITKDQWPDSRPFVVLAPQHAEVPSSPCMEASEIEQFLVFALKHYDIDPKRVYLTGLSCGAIGLWNYLGQHTNEVVAAAVPMAGYGLGAVDEAGCNLAALPIWAFHGAHDDSDPVWGDAYPLTYLQSSRKAS
jgi:hypothetical protein